VLHEAVSVERTAYQRPAADAELDGRLRPFRSQALHHQWVQVDIYLGRHTGLRGPQQVLSNPRHLLSLTLVTDSGGCFQKTTSISRDCLPVNALRAMSVQSGSVASSGCSPWAVYQHARFSEPKPTPTSIAEGRLGIAEQMDRRSSDATAIIPGPGDDPVSGSETVGHLEPPNRTLCFLPLPTAKHAHVRVVSDFVRTPL
jgi:hypothetical protein